MNDQNDPFRHPASALALEVFRLNGTLIAHGDSLVAPFGLTSARWQVLGAIERAGGAATVSDIARGMGLTRQSVQRLVDEMDRTGLIELVDNPHHRRARLVRLSTAGRTAFAAALTAWQPQADAAVSGLGPDAIASALSVLRTVRERLSNEHRQEKEE